MFCKPCRHFSEAGTEHRFNKIGFKDWKHEASRAHAAALAWTEGYKQSHQGLGSIVNQLNQDAMNRWIVQRNRDHLKSVIRLVLFCAKQNIPLHGHRENTEALNKDNFMELFKLLTEFLPDMAKRLDELPGNATLMSPDIQNEILEIATSLIIWKMKTELQEETGTYYTILADECKDLSKRELVPVCLRYIHKGLLMERAVGFVENGDMSASAISAKILDVLEPLQVDPALCVGFGFDGASVMSGHKGRVQVI